MILRRKLVVFVILTLLLCADAWTTLALSGEELNPIADWFLVRGWLWHLKIGAAVVVGVATWLARKSERALVWLWAVVAVYVVVVGWNLSQLWLAR